MPAQVSRLDDVAVPSQSSISARFRDLYPELLSRACAIAAHERDPEEVIQEILGFSWWNYAQAARRGKWLTPSQLSWVAMHRVRGEGCTLGSHRTKTDVLSAACRRHGRSRILYLSHFDNGTYPAHIQQRFDEVIGQGLRNPADEAATRIDWRTLRSALPDRLQRVLDGLVAGRGPSEIARRMRLTPGRICQLRDELGRHVADFFKNTMPELTIA